MDHKITRAIRLSLLRGFGLQVNDQPLHVIPSAQRLLAFLGLREGPVSRAHVAGILWPDTPTHRANANLRSSIWRAHRAGRYLIVVSPQQIALGTHVTVDVRTATMRAHSLLDTGTHSDEATLSAHTRLDLSADLLPDWYDEWVLLERERFRQLRLHALEAMCERLTAEGRYGEAVDAGLAAVRAEPLRESAHRVVMYAHLAEGNQSEAMRHYEQYRYLLLEELAVEPSPALRAMLPRASTGRVSAGRPTAK